MLAGKKGELADHTLVTQVSDINCECIWSESLKIEKWVIVDQSFKGISDFLVYKFTILPMDIFIKGIRSTALIWVKAHVQVKAHPHSPENFTFFLL